MNITTNGNHSSSHLYNKCIASTLNYINILQPVHFNVFLHGYLLQCNDHLFSFVLKTYTVISKHEKLH